jgi:hypothetical protein
MSVIPKIPRASGGLCPLGPYQGSALDQLGTLSGPQIPRLLTPPLTTNPGSAPGDPPPQKKKRNFIYKKKYIINLWTYTNNTANQNVGKHDTPHKKAWHISTV